MYQENLLLNHSDPCSRSLFSDEPIAELTQANASETI